MQISFRRMLCIATFAFAYNPVFAAFDSGSTGADGALAPTTNTTVPLPPSGVLNYTSVNIPQGVTVSFQRNTANTPVTMLVKGNTTIAGTINVSGAQGASAALPVILGVTNKGGRGGPGGFDGGMGGAPEQNRNGGAGFGPGSGGGAIASAWKGCGGNFGTTGGATCGTAGSTYGSNAMLPVIGGSGGGGGRGSANLSQSAGAGGGGGGGALLLVSSGSVELTGQILAKGGDGGHCGSEGSSGGGGAGGMVRILAVGFSGSGSISISGGAGGCPWSMYGTETGGGGGDGRKSIEVVPNGGAFNPAILPGLAITSIGGTPVPANPSGSGDVTAPMALGNPLEVVVSGSGIPLGSVIKLTLNDNAGSIVTANTAALAGTLQSSTATGSINIPSGSSVLMASTTYALTVAQGQALSMYAQGERVEKVSLAAVLGGEQQVTLITVSGKEYRVPAAVLAMLPS